MGHTEGKDTLVDNGRGNLRTSMRQSAKEMAILHGLARLVQPDWREAGLLPPVTDEFAEFRPEPGMRHPDGRHGGPVRS